MELTNSEKKIIKYLKGKDFVDVEELFKIMDKNEVASAVSWLKEKKLVNVDERPFRIYALGKEGKRVLEKGLPEEKLLKLIDEGIVDLQELQKYMGDDLRFALAQFYKFGGRTQNGKIYIENPEPLKEYVTKVKDLLIGISNGKNQDIDVSPVKGRKDFVEEKVRMRRKIKLTEQAYRIPEEELVETEEINQITPELIERYNESIKLRPYDVMLYAPRALPAKIHPLSEFIDIVRKKMIAMGFQELYGNYIENTFWNMDVLFIPQNHPARDMQDTFYVEGSATPDKEMAEKVKEVHENGLGNGKGWGYSWSIEEASRKILRTHTTVNTIRYLIEHPHEPCKIFSVERIFRRENLDSKHLAEFTQVEGVISGPGVNFGVLIRTLREFYNSLGINDLKFKPSFFPYTEPSLEIFGKFMGKYMELGGAGLFRPEVLKPWGINYQVAAWGLGLERLLMLVLNLDDIRDIYRNDLAFLQERRIIKIK